MSKTELMTFLLSNTNNLYTHQPSPSPPPRLSAWHPSQPAAPPSNLVVKSGLLFPLLPSSLNRLDHGPSLCLVPIAFHLKSQFPCGGACRAGLPPSLASRSLPTLITCQLFERATLNYLRAFAHTIGCPENILRHVGRAGSFSSFNS